MSLKCSVVVIIAIFVEIGLGNSNPAVDVSRFFNKDVNSRIVGGTVAGKGTVPYMVGLQDGFLVRSFVCGGSLVTVRSVLTAAHCIEIVYNAVTGLSINLRGRIGSNQYNMGGVAYRFSYNVTHPDYSRAIIKNDIGLLITTSEVQLTSTAAVVPLNFYFVGAGVRAKVAGWGRTSSGSQLSLLLLELQVDTMDGQRCVEDAAAASALMQIPAPHVDPSLEICTDQSPGFGTCGGDSGSALVEVSTGRQIGIVSWSFSCAQGAPDMFTRVSAFQDWLGVHLV